VCAVSPPPTLQFEESQAGLRPATFLVTGGLGSRKRAVAEEFALYRCCEHISASSVLQLACDAVEIEVSTALPSHATPLTFVSFDTLIARGGGQLYQMPPLN
jgi:hypothetical protein